MISINMLITVVSITLSFMTLAIVLTLLIRNRKEQRYDVEKQRATIEMMRNSYEKRIYELEERLTGTPQRWKDANHLILNSQDYQESFRLRQSRTALTGFLRAAGLTEDDPSVDRKLVFYLTSYNEKYANVYEAVKEVCGNVGLKCVRGDEQYFASDFLTHILRQLVRANIVIANIDGRSPNVYYELGIAHAMDKRTIILSRSISELPADIKSKRIVLYRERNELDSALKSEITKALLEE
jgi:hypothetical protein